MPQTFHVLLCVICKTFQVQIVKKSSNKWDCKICGSKQSVQQVYAKGTGGECREIVQRLNEARGKREENIASVAQAQVEQEACGDYFTINDPFCESHEDKSDYSSTSQAPIATQDNDKPVIPCVPREKSKWTVFLED